MRLRSTRAWAGFNDERFSSSDMGSVGGGFDLHQVPHLSQHTQELRTFLVLGRAADLPQAERAERAAMALALPDGAADLRDPEARHQDCSSGLSPPFTRRRAFFRSPPASSATLPTTGTSSTFSATAPAASLTLSTTPAASAGSSVGVSVAAATVASVASAAGASGADASPAGASEPEAAGCSAPFEASSSGASSSATTRFFG